METGDAWFWSWHQHCKMGEHFKGNTVSWDRGLNVKILQTKQHSLLAFLRLFWWRVWWCWRGNCDWRWSRVCRSWRVCWAGVGLTVRSEGNNPEEKVGVSNRLWSLVTLHHSHQSTKSAHIERLTPSVWHETCVLGPSSSHCLYDQTLWKQNTVDTHAHHTKTMCFIPTNFFTKIPRFVHVTKTFQTHLHYKQMTMRSINCSCKNTVLTFICLSTPNVLLHVETNDEIQNYSEFESFPPPV